MFYQLFKSYSAFKNDFYTLNYFTFCHIQTTNLNLQISQKWMQFSGGVEEIHSSGVSVVFCEIKDPNSTQSPVELFNEQKNK